MQETKINLSQLKAAPWNPNQMKPEDLQHLKKSLQTFGLVQNLVVRPLASDQFEVLSGNQRLKVLQELQVSPITCVVVDANDIQARILAQALNHVHGTDDLGLRAQVLRQVLETISEQELVEILPETKESLAALTSLGQDTIASYIQNWQQAQSSKLKHFQFQLTHNQTDIVEEALEQVLPTAKKEKGGSPNVRGTALFLICKFYLEKQNHEK